MELEQQLVWLAQNNGSLHIDYYGDVVVIVNGKGKEIKTASAIKNWHPMDEPSRSSVASAIIESIKKAQAL